MFRRRSVGCFSRRSEPNWRLRRAYLESIRKERATRKNSQLATAQRVAMKMGRRLRCSSVTYPLRYAPSTASPARTALPATHFDRNETYAYFGDRTPAFVRFCLTRFLLFRLLLFQKYNLKKTRLSHSCRTAIYF